MSCKDCEARRKMAREALLSAHIGKAAKHIATGAAEAVGLKEKTGTEELRSTESSWPFSRTKKKPARARKAQYPKEPQDQTLTPAPPENSPYGAGD